MNTSSESRLIKSMLSVETHQTNTANRPLSISLAQNAGEVREAQKLRYQVFGEEMGARLESSSEGIDRDMFDAYCDHLLVRDNQSVR